MEVTGVRFAGRSNSSECLESNDLNERRAGDAPVTCAEYEDGRVAVKATAWEVTEGNYD